MSSITNHDEQASQSAETVAAAASSKKAVYVDPEVVQKRREEKAAKKAKQQAEAAIAKQHEPDTDNTKEELGFLTREFMRLDSPAASEKPLSNGCKRTVKLMTWNMLAQALVRRTLFPGSDMLKWKDRGPVLSQVLPYYSPSVACLQEVDKWDEAHAEELSKAGYDTAYTTGYPAKLHGLCIAWKREQYEEVKRRCIKLDDAQYEPGRTGCSRATRNIGLLVALRFKDREDGIIVVTQHLFWHARHHYERARQIAFLLREIHRFREEHAICRSWPCFFAGDFNIQPSEGSYRLLTGASLVKEQEDSLSLSTVVHRSLDEHKSRLASAAESDQAGDHDIKEDDENDSSTPTENGTGEVYAQPDGDEDRVLKNTRPARPEDGLMSLDELKSVYEKYGKGAFSVYGHNYGRLEKETGNWYGERDGKPATALESSTKQQRVLEGYYEPA